jgi:hypothetical protein
MRIDTADYITCTNAANAVGISRQAMRKRAELGKVRSVVIDGLLFVHKDDARPLKLTGDNRRS